MILLAINSYLCKINKKKVTKMPERLESVKLQIQIPKKLRDNLEKQADETGVTLNQYLIFLMLKSVDDHKA